MKTGNNTESVAACNKKIREEGFDVMINQNILPSIDQALATDYNSLALPNNHIFVKQSRKLIRISYDDILFFEKVGDYISVKSNHGQILISQSIVGLLTKLNNPRFVKVHRSFIINIDKISDIEDYSVRIDKKYIPVSRALKPKLLDLLNIV